MTIGEFVKIDPNIIRRDKELMQLYINFYEAAFSIIPNCAGCSFKSGFKKLKRYANNQGKNIKFDTNTNQMKAKTTFLLKKEHQLKILSYLKDGKTYRSYGYNLTEEFANDLVKAGKEDLFKTLPKAKKEAKVSKPKTVSNYASMDYHKEVLPLYTKVKERTGKEAESKKKVDIIKFLEVNEN